MTRQVSIHRTFTEAEKHEAARMVLSGEYKLQQIMDKFGIYGKRTVYRWMVRRGYYVREVPLDSTIKESELSKSKVDKSSSVSELLNRINELEAELRTESLRREAYQRFVEIAKRDYDIDLVKKSETKQSPK